MNHGWVIWGYGVSSIYGNKKKNGGGSMEGLQLHVMQFLKYAIAIKYE